MDISNNRHGKYIESSIGEEKYQSFLPPILPFAPPLIVSTSLNNKIRLAYKKINDLNLLLNYKISNIDPFNTLLVKHDSSINVNLFLYFAIRKEALLSSQIEGTQSSFDDLLLFESDEKSNKEKLDVEDVEEVSNYVAALNHGLTRINNGFPLCAILIREVHAILLQGGRGSNKNPGNFRTSQNWIGGSRPGNALFVPPPQETLKDYISNLEKYLNSETNTLIKAAIAHAQFETLHPFLDGNGRMGRLLITLLLCNDNILKQPILYLSLYFKERRKDYYAQLDATRGEGNWEKWVDFFIDVILYALDQTQINLGLITNLIEEDVGKILNKLNKRAQPTAMALYDLSLNKVNFTIQAAAKELKQSQPTIIYAIENLKGLSIISESTGKQRDRIFVYEKYLALLKSGT